MFLRSLPSVARGGARAAALQAQRGGPTPARWVAMRGVSSGDLDVAGITARIECATTMKMPSLMESREGTVLEWLKNEGEKVAEGDSLCLVEVGDVRVEMVAPFDGILADTLVEAHLPVPTDEGVAVLCETREAYMEYFDAVRVAAHEAEMVRVLQEAKAEREIRPSAGIVLREVRHMQQQGHLEAASEDPTFVSHLMTLARKGHPELLVAFDASFEGMYFNAETFNAAFFLEQAKVIVSAEQAEQA